MKPSESIIMGSDIPGILELLRGHETRITRLERGRPRLPRVLMVRCADCGAEVGERCVGPSGKAFGKTHKVRMQTARGA